MAFAVRSSGSVDIDSSDALKVINSAFHLANDHQKPRIEQYRRDYKLFNGFIDMTTRDPDRSNVFIPKIRQIIRTKVPRSIKALAGVRPYLPFEAKRPEFRDGVKVWVDFIDDLLESGNYLAQLVLADLMAHTYGTGYLDYTPRLEPMDRPVIDMSQGVPRLKTETSARLTLDVKAWAPWEVYPDPFATGLERPGQCRFLVKLQLASRRELIKLAKSGGYPGVDIEALMSDKLQMGTFSLPHAGNHPGLELLNAIGLHTPPLDNDIGVLMRLESDDRYIDAWNGTVMLRDVQNPYGRVIHTSRIIHGMDPHTQNQFHGEGDVKPNEALQELFNDMFDQAVNSWNMMDQPVTYYDKKAFQGPANQLVRTMGNKIPMDVPNDRRIQDVVLESYGHELPMTHFQMLSQVRDFMDMGSQSTPISRGEISEDDPTATEIGLASERSSDAQELDVRLAENILLASMGRKIINSICSISPIDDIIESVGLEAAVQAFFMNPLGIPGGYNMAFKGSDRVANLAIRQNKWLSLSQELRNLGSTLPGALSLKLLEVYDEDTPEAKAMVIPDQVRMMLEFAQEQRQFQQQQQLKSGDKPASGQKAGSGNAKQIRQSVN